MSTTCTVKRKEAKNISFTVTSGGENVDLTAKTISLVIKRRATDTEAAIEKTTDDFTLSGDNNHIATVTLTEDDLDLTPATYLGELKIVLDENNIDKSDTFNHVIETSLHS